MCFRLERRLQRGHGRNTDTIWRRDEGRVMEHDRDARHVARLGVRCLHFTHQPWPGGLKSTAMFRARVVLGIAKGSKPC